MAPLGRRNLPQAHSNVDDFELSRVVGLSGETSRPAPQYSTREIGRSRVKSGVLARGVRNFGASGEAGKFDGKLQRRARHFSSVCANPVNFRSFRSGVSPGARL